MARKKVREYDAKRILREAFKRLQGTELPIRCGNLPGLAFATATCSSRGTGAPGISKTSKNRSIGPDSMAPYLSANPSRCPLCHDHAHRVAQANAATNFAELLQQQPWLGSSKLVVKPDMLFGQRGKHDLVGLNLSYPQVHGHRLLQGQEGKNHEI